MNSIIINNVSKKYKNFQALDNINLNIKGIYGLLGPNGAGKTTLMKILATLIEKNAGKISYSNITWEEKQNVRKILGYLPQNFSIYPTVTVLECLNHLAILKGVKNKKDRINMLETLLNDTNLNTVKNKRIKELSGGMLRRVGIAQALIGNPEIIIVDEPTAGLDIEERVRFRNMIHKIGEKRIVIISTHIVGDIENICEYICVMKEGKVLAEGTQQEICNHARGLIWEVKVNNDEASMILQKYHVISTKQDNDNNLILRILSDEQPSNISKEVSPNLEDGYISLVRAGD